MANGTCPPPFDIGDYNFSEYDYPGVMRPFTWRESLKVMAYVVVFLLALLGNVLIMLVVYFNQHMRTTTNFYLVNLAVADVLIAVCCMWVHLIKNLTYPLFVLGAFFCKIDAFAQTTSLTASVLTLTAISCDRFVAVLFPLRARLTQQRAWVVISMVWIVSAGVSAPFLFHREFYNVRWKNYVESQCVDVWQAVNSWNAESETCITTYPAKKIYYTFFSVTLFFFPVTVMTVTYSLLVWRLWTSKLPGERSDAAVLIQLRAKKKVVKMVLIVLLVFILCWMPLQILVLYAVYGHTQVEGLLPEWFENLEYVAYFIAYSNSASNPVIYCGFNAHFRQGLLGILRCSLIQDFRAKRGKSSTLTTNAGSGRLRDGPTAFTAAGFGHEMSDLGPPQFLLQMSQKSHVGGNHHQVCLMNHSVRRKSSGDFEEVTLGVGVGGCDAVVVCVSSRTSERSSCDVKNK